MPGPYGILDQIKDHPEHTHYVAFTTCSKLRTACASVAPCSANSAHLLVRGRNCMRNYGG